MTHNHMNDGHNGMDTYLNSVNLGHTPQDISWTEFICGACLLIGTAIAIVLALGALVK